MKIIKLNVYEEQRKWIEQHQNAADEMECDITGVPLTAIYHSPLRKWRGLMKADGTIEIPDVDYYNQASPSEKNAFTTELFADIFSDPEDAPNP